MRLGDAVPTWAIIGLSAGLIAAAAGAQEPPSVCNGGHVESVSARSSLGCAQQRFDRARQGAEALREEQSAAALPGAEGLRQQFRQADEDGDGRISRDEWLRWFGPAYADTATAGQPSGPN